MLSTNIFPRQGGRVSRRQKLVTGYMRLKHVAIRKDVCEVPLRGKEARSTQRQYLKSKHTILCIQETFVEDPQDYLECGSREWRAKHCVMVSLSYFIVFWFSSC